MANEIAFIALAEGVDREEFCVSSFCTTCGCRPFRNALKAIPKEDVITGLRHLSLGFLVKHSDMFQLVILEITPYEIYTEIFESLDGTPADEVLDSLAGTPVGELLDALDGTPAGERLRTYIEYRYNRHVRWKAYLVRESPEAIAERVARRKAAREIFTAPHRLRKSESQNSIRVAMQALKMTPDVSILAFVERNDLGVPLRAIGGLVYDRLLRHYLATPIHTEDLKILSQFAGLASGHWKKLLIRLL